MRRKLAVLFILLFLVQAFLPCPAYADEDPYALKIVVSGEEKQVRAYDREYAGNPYLSLVDLAAALNGTEKQFRFERIISSTDGEYFSVTMRQTPVIASGAEGFSGYSDPIGLFLFRNRILVDGVEKKYYTYNPQNGDLYMSLTDVQLMLNLTAVPMETGGFWFDVSRAFQPDIQRLKEQGYFDGMSGVYLASADSGNVLFQYHSRVAVPVASLTKLLSYLVLKEAIDRGEIGAGDYVRISDKAEAISKSGDGIITLHAGEEVPLSELMGGMLVASSNESALALAEHLCGDEAAFVARMHQRAAELGLNSVLLYNCHGLPSYSFDNIPVKRQNYMSAEDLFRLSKLILQQYPEITEITSARYAHFPSLEDYWTANSNPLVFNMNGVTGLKTGHTNQAGYCVAASMPVETAQGTQTVILILLGCESADLRGQAAEILLRYAKAQLDAS